MKARDDHGRKQSDAGFSVEGNRDNLGASEPAITCQQPDEPHKPRTSYAGNETAARELGEKPLTFAQCLPCDSGVEFLIGDVPFGTDQDLRPIHTLSGTD